MTLLVSTCRNHLLTANAVFADYRLILLDSTNFAPTYRAVEHLLRGEPNPARALLGEASKLLDEIQSKRAVWDARFALYDEIQTAVSSLSPTDAARVQNILRSRPAAGAQIDANDIAFRRIELQSDARAERAFEHLDRIDHQIRCGYELARHALKVATTIAEAVEDQARMQGRLPLGGPANLSEKINAAMSAAIEAIRGMCVAAGYCRVTDNTEIDAISIALTGPDPETLDVSHTYSTPERGRELVRALALLSKRFFDHAKQTVSDSFRPNVARPPMPAPFLIDLTEPPSDLAPAEVPIVNRIPIETHRDISRARIALVNLILPPDWLQTDSHRIAQSATEPLLAMLEAACAEASDQQADFLVFPELCIPRDQLTRIENIASAAHLGVIAGLEGEFHPRTGRAINEAVIYFPDRREYFQRKQRPSVYERRAPAFHSDGRLTLFTGTAIGDFAVLICNDFLEEDLTSILRQEAPQLLVVCAMNPHPDVYRPLARADAARLYCFVAIANTAFTNDSPPTEDATLVASFYRTPGFVTPRIVQEITPTSWPTGCHAHLSVYDLDLSACSGRLQERPSSGYLPPPHCMRPRG